MTNVRTMEHDTVGIVNDTKKDFQQLLDKLYESCSRNIEVGISFITTYFTMNCGISVEEILEDEVTISGDNVSISFEESDIHDITFVKDENGIDCIVGFEDISQIIFSFIW